MRGTPPRTTPIRPFDGGALPLYETRDAHEETEERPRRPRPGVRSSGTTPSSGAPRPPVAAAAAEAAPVPAAGSPRRPAPTAFPAPPLEAGPRIGPRAPRGGRGPPRRGGPPDRPRRLHRGAPGTPRPAPPRAPGHPRPARVAGHAGRLPRPALDEHGMDPDILDPRPGRPGLPPRNLVAGRRARGHAAPDGPSSLVANHGGTAPWDAAVLRARRRPPGTPRELRPAPRPPRALRRPGGRRSSSGWAPRRSAPRSRSPCSTAGRASPLPGGAARGRRAPGPTATALTRFGRGGFARIAALARAPIVPCAIVGSEEAAAPFDRRGWLADALHLPLLSLAPPLPAGGAALLASRFPPAGRSASAIPSRRPRRSGPRTRSRSRRPGSASAPSYSACSTPTWPPAAPSSSRAAAAGRAGGRRGRAAAACAGPRPAPASASARSTR